MGLEKADKEFDKIGMRDKFIRDNFTKAKSNSNLTEWEQEFLDTISFKIENGEDLSQRQFNTLKEIADK